MLKCLEMSGKGNSRENKDYLQVAGGNSRLYTTGENSEFSVFLKVWSWDQQPGNRMERQIPGPTLVLLAGLLWGRGVQPPTCTDPLVTVMHSGCSITELCIECA